MATFRSKTVSIEADQYLEGTHPPGLCGCPEKDGPHAHGKQGSVTVKIGDWLIAELDGSGRYPCAPDIFAAKYEPAHGALSTAGQTFGWALKQLQNGARVQREGWNGKGMYLYLDRGAIRTALTVAGNDAGAVSYEPCIVMFTAQGRYQPGWLASQPDMFATDWRIVQ